MTGSRPAVALMIGLFALLLGGAARGDGEDLSAGKTPAQLFRLNCAACHKSPRGLAKAGEKAGGLFGLENFLAQHYTASGPSADLIAGYLKSVDSGAPPERRSSPRRKAAKPQEPAGRASTAKASDKSEKKTGEAESAEPKADAAKAELTDEKSAAPETDKPAVTEAKPDKKKPVSHPSQAKRKEPTAAGQKTD